MFEIPDAKRVRREDLFESGSDEEQSQDDTADAELEQRLNSQLAGLLDLDFVNPAAVQQAEGPVDEAAVTADAPAEEAPAAAEPEEVAFEFRLFRDEGPAHTVTIKQQDEDVGAAGEGGFVVPKRPRSYYVAEEPDQDIISKLRKSAVSADYILSDSKRRRWGLEKPWKVTSIVVTVDGHDKTPLRTQGSESEARRKRPGKKRRIILRKRAQARKEIVEATKQHELEKEEHIKEKKKRLNRQKKLKRRAKEREKKAAATGQEGEGEEDEEQDRMSVDE